MKRKKDLNRDELKRFFSVLHELNDDEKELHDIVNDKQERIYSLLEQSPPWSHFYEIPYSHLLAIFVTLIGMDRLVVEAAKESLTLNEVLQRFEEFSSDIDEKLESDDISDEESSIFLSIFMAILGNIWCLKIFNIPMNTLLERVKSGDDKALFDAVLVDRVALSAPAIARRIQMAHMLEDESFFDSLSKAIKRTRPRRPLKELDDTRYMVEAIDELHGLSNISHEELFDFLANDLEIYHSAEDKKDPAAALKQLINRRKYRP